MHRKEDKSVFVDPNFLIDASEALGISEFEYIYANKTQSCNFKIVRSLAKGGYGEVYVVEYGEKVYAMKKVPKHLVIKNINTTFFMNEKEIMTSLDSEWLVKCHFCVQDPFYLYYIMDFIPGGDLMGYLSKIDVLEEDKIRFFAAEIFAAVNEMHRLGWIHRDLKPDNILIDCNGHIKLGDFGSCIKMVNGRAESSITVGTPDYVSPDLLVAVGETISYGPEVDYWTVGVIIYEMLCGITPFYSESLAETYSKILAIEYTLCDDVSPEMRDLIGRLLCKKEKRIVFEEVKKHIFFKGIDWDNIRSTVAPHRPRISNAIDISNFVDTEFVPDNTNVRCDFRRFIGFTYDPEHCKRLIIRFNDKKRVLDSKENIEYKICENINEDKKKDNLCEKIPEDYTLVLNEYEEIKKRLVELRKELEEKELEKQKIKEEMENGEYSKFKEIESKLNSIMISNDLSAANFMDSNINNDKINNLKESKDEDKNLYNHIEGNANNISVVKNINLDKGMTVNKKRINDLKGHVMGIRENTDEIRKMGYWLYKRNIALCTELGKWRDAYERESQERINQDAMLQELEKKLEGKCGEILEYQEEMREYQQRAEQEVALRKELRIRRTEVREYQQKFEQEAAIRKELEREVLLLRRAEQEREIEREVMLRAQATTMSSSIALKMSLVNVMTNKPMDAVIRDGQLTLRNFPPECINKNIVATINNEELVCSLSNIFIRELKNHELHYLAYNKRLLVTVIHFLGEPTRTSHSGGTRRSLKALEADYAKEESILRGLDSLIKVLDGVTLKDALAQKEGSEKKIKELKEEIGKAKKSTITEHEVDDNEKVAEFNNHLFYEKTVAKGTLCDYCNEPLYGLIRQAYCCRDCLLVVHKHCYILVNVSCEMYQSMKRGTAIFVACKSTDEKERLLNLNKI